MAGFLDKAKQVAQQALDEAKKGNMDMEYTPGEELQKLLNELMNQPPDVIERVKKILTD